MSWVAGNPDYLAHRITLDGRTVCRDGKQVRITGNPKTRDLQIGCTFVSRDALCRLLELSTNLDICPEIVVQS